MSVEAVDAIRGIVVCVLELAPMMRICEPESMNVPVRVVAAAREGEMVLLVLDGRAVVVVALRERKGRRELLPAAEIEGKAGAESDAERVDVGAVALVEVLEELPRSSAIPVSQFEGSVISLIEQTRAGERFTLGKKLMNWPGRVIVVTPEAVDRSGTSALSLKYQVKNQARAYYCANCKAKGQLEFGAESEKRGQAHSRPTRARKVQERLIDGATIARA